MLDFNGSEVIPNGVGLILTRILPELILLPENLCWKRDEMDSSETKEMK